mgnify:FL=1
MANGTTPAGLIRRGQRQVQTRGALGMSNISKEAQDVFRMLSGYLTDIKERRLSGGEKATEVEKEQKKQGDWWGYGSGLVTFLVLSPIIGPAAAAGVSGITSAGVRKAAEDLTRRKVGVGGIALGKDELPIPPKPKYYQTQYEKLPIARGEAKFDLENLYQMGRQMALPRSLGTGWNVYRAGNLLTDLYSGIKDMFADKADVAYTAGEGAMRPGMEQAGAYDNLLQMSVVPGYQAAQATTDVLDPSYVPNFLKDFGAPSQRWKLPGGPPTSRIFDYPESYDSGIEAIRRYIRQGSI